MSRISVLRTLSLCLSLLCLSFGGVVLAEEGRALSLSSQVVVDQQELEISESDWHWLRQRRELVMGVLAQGYPPLEIVQAQGAYQGMTPDAAALLGQMLGLQIRLRAYPDRAALEKALLAGDIDLFGADGHGEQEPGLARSLAYGSSRLALFRRGDDRREFPDDLKDLKVAYTPGHGDAVALFPSAQALPVDTVEEGVADAAFGRADLLLADVVPVYYLLNRAFYGTVRFERYVDWPGGELAFVVRQSDPQLLRGIDGALRAVGRSRLDEIARRWVGNGVMPAAERMVLTPEEARWVQRHPVVRVAVDDDLAPLAFFDGNGQFQGIIAELLDLVRLRTGLRFEAVSRTGGYAGQIDALTSGLADVGLLTQDHERETLLRFTRPITSSPFVLVTRSGADGLGESVGDLSGRVLALGRGHVAREAIRRAFPKAELVEPGSTLDALHSVDTGRADAALVGLPVARYYLVRMFQGRLAIAQVAPVGPATANFAVRRGDTELQAILDRALAELSPDELAATANRWRGMPGMSPQTWRDYGVLIQRIIIGAAVLLLLVLAWVLHLRRQVRRRQLAERQLQDELRFIETLIDSMPPPVYVRDTEGRLLSCNRSYLQTLGLPREAVIGLTVTELPVDFPDAAEFHQRQLQAIAEGQLQRSVHELSLGGRTLWIEHWIQPFQDSTGVTRGVICGWLDLTEHHNLVLELEAAKNMADAASRAKTTFLATMSHEIRTPMNAVIGILELALKRAADRPIDPASIEVAYTSAKGLLELIGDILDIARIESGRLSLSPRRANLRELVESVARVFDGLARQKGLVLNLDIDGGIQGDVLVDGMRFKQVLSNLVSNAIKFTREGSVSVRIHGEDGESDQLHVYLSVVDTGIGIDPADQARLFQPFEQVQRSTGAMEGAGLGLVICRSLCEMMGGRLTLDSALGRGTRVDVELRLLRLDPIPLMEIARQEEAQARRRLKVLVVDDHPVNRQILAQQLAYLGHTVVEAADGVDALARWREQPFDVVATDCHMPRMNGADLARAIREDERQQGRVPVLILGLTADAQQEEVERGLKAGMDDCLVKPIGLDLLEEKLGGAPGASPAPVEPPAGEAAALFDLSPLAPLTGGDPGLAVNLLRELLNTNRRDLAALEEQVRQHDASALFELAHRLKGAARVIKATQVIEACEYLSRASVVERPRTEALEAGVEAVRRALDALERGLIQQMPELQ
ncbi:hybrid sensor histidine kinase/response regulator [Metapseudomonas otitidis]|uniref:histidine kinase n=1 Tax=Metapseudomonas otitidis TaxID=319939 RepID=A0A6S5RIK0_9GAMM|nr:transporter substrate-binding domain-containing protein [Pseudomonas otitidis]BBT14420.1 hybrid sensor histidine kinase/response regulator [Pseudomonas otitidis]